jgi:hypothetical protein
MPRSSRQSRAKALAFGIGSRQRQQGQSKQIHRVLGISKRNTTGSGLLTQFGIGLEHVIRNEVFTLNVVSHVMAECVDVTHIQLLEERSKDTGDLAFHRTYPIPQDTSLASSKGCG